MDVNNIQEADQQGIYGVDQDAQRETFGHQIFTGK